MSSSIHIEILPAEIIIEIFKFLPYLDRFLLGRTSKQFKGSLESCEYFWKKTYEQVMKIPKGQVPLSGKKPKYWKQKVVECLKAPSFVPCEASIVTRGGKVFSTKTKWKRRFCTSTKAFSGGKHLLAFRTGSDGSDQHQKKLGEAKEKSRSFSFTLGLTPALHSDKMDYDVSTYGCGTSFSFCTDGSWRVDSTQNRFIKTGDHASARYKFHLMSFEQQNMREKFFERTKLGFGRLIFMYFDLDERLLAFFMEQQVLTVCQPFFDDIGGHKDGYDRKHHAEVLKEDYETQNPKKFYLMADASNCRKPNWNNFVQILDYEIVPFEYDERKVQEYLETQSIPRINEKIRNMEKRSGWEQLSVNQSPNRRKKKKKKKRRRGGKK